MKVRMRTCILLLLLPSVLLGCSAASSPPEDDTATGESAINTVGSNPLNVAAGSLILYEAQVRTANACHPDVGSAAQRTACLAKAAPKVKYRAEGMSCGDRDNLEKIKLGTLDDMVEDTADFRKGITVRYLKERVGANALWLMPLFPNN
ncbi:MAG TPA: hypothetical protein VLT33_23595, partial [Labilithrix sp.]|nr:hypothetical protein [Labilithrix sp.]